MMNPQPFRAFSSWADEHAVEGLTSEGKTAKYLPHSAQSRYWNPTKIKEIIQERNSVTNDEDVSDYICVFSILVYMEANGMSVLHYLNEIMRRGYDDASLPWSGNLNARHDIFGSIDDLQKFIDTQWMFYPMPAGPFLVADSTTTSRVFMPNGVAKSIHNRLVHTKQIFPITKVLDESIDTSRATRTIAVSHIQVHPQPSTQQSSTDSNIVVFKTYPPEHEKIYRDTCRGYIAMRGARDSSSILQYLGSFHYVTEGGEQISTIISEVADAGTLTDLFLGNKVPYRVEYIRAMWGSLLGALYGVSTIHNRNSTYGSICFHQGFGPSNFFLFNSKDEKRPFSYAMKIGDFGSTRSRSAILPVPEDIASSQGAIRTYDPPETYLGDVNNFKVESSSDMWSIGCIITEMAVWITGGELALGDFRRLRMQETEGLEKHKTLGWSDCFHDGSVVLESVKGIVQNIDENRRKRDKITPAMAELALKSVLVEKKERLQVDQLISKMGQVLREEKETKPQSVDTIAKQLSGPTSHLAPPMNQHEPQLPDANPGSPDIHNLKQSSGSEMLKPHSELSIPAIPQLPDSSQPSMLVSEVPLDIRPLEVGHTVVSMEVPQIPRVSNFPLVNIDQLKEWANGSKTQNRELRGRNEAKLLLDGRDFMFLIDDSKYTMGHKEEIKTWTTSLAYLLKAIDPDGIDIAYTSAPHDRESVRTKTEMAKSVDQTLGRVIGVDCMIENALDVILSPIKAKWTQNQGSPSTGRRNRFSIPGLGMNHRNQTSRGVTILVFTNGVWEAKAGGTCGAQKPIRSLIESMRKNDIPRTQVSIQFVRLGSDERGIRRLEFLDNELDKDFDIVDTKPTTASIWDILIGPMQGGTDNKPATSS